MKRIIAILLIAATAALALSACGGAAGPEQLLAGRWYGSVGNFEFQSMEFIPDEDDPARGRVNLMLGNLVSGSYEVLPPEQRGEPAGLNVTYTLGMISHTLRYSFTLDETTLVLRGEKSGLDLTYTRAGGE